VRARFGFDGFTYSSHGYAASKPGYTPAHAVDFGPIGTWGQMATGTARAKGDELAAFLVKNWQAFGLHNVIWYERINTGSGWKYYDWRPYYNAGYGSRDVETHRHGDHVHVQCSNAGLIGEYVE
jgi:peptidoglycan DL-endopeptidase CwlO